jgi:hypothetical protein
LENFSETGRSIGADVDRNDGVEAERDHVWPET